MDFFFMNLGERNKEIGQDFSDRVSLKLNFKNLLKLYSWYKYDNVMVVPGICHSMVKV